MKESTLFNQMIFAQRFLRNLRLPSSLQPSSLHLRPSFSYPAYRNLIPTNITTTRTMTNTSGRADKISQTTEKYTDELEALEKYTACDVADALLKLKVPNAGFIPDLNVVAPPSASLKTDVVIAPASTVVFASKSGGDMSGHPEANIPTGTHWVDLTMPGTIVVMAQPEGQKCAVLGGIMALRMKVLGAKGVVVGGRVRDVVELGETGLPVSLRKGIPACSIFAFPFPLRDPTTRHHSLRML